MVVEKCESDPAWADIKGFTCTNYEKKGWCVNGDVGPNWDVQFGDFADYTIGFDPAADQACCECGGGIDEVRTDEALLLCSLPLSYNGYLSSTLLSRIFSLLFSHTSLLLSRLTRCPM